MAASGSNDGRRARDRGASRQDANSPRRRWIRVAPASRADPTKPPRRRALPLLVAMLMLAPLASAAPAAASDHVHWHFHHISLQGARPDANESNDSGTQFVDHHRAMTADYDAWREAHGHERVVAWGPATPVPSEFRGTKPGCMVHTSDDPRVPLPTWATLAGGDEEDPVCGSVALCDFPTLNAFAKSLAYAHHDRVRGAVGGDMGPVSAPRDPLFWAWHKHVDALFFDDEQACSDADAPLPVKLVAAADGGRERATPGPGAATMLLALACLALLRRR